MVAARENACNHAPVQTWNSRISSHVKTILDSLLKFSQINADIYMLMDTNPNKKHKRTLHAKQNYTTKRGLALGQVCNCKHYI